MRNIICLLGGLILAALSPAAAQHQPLEVLIVGTSHYNGSDTATYRPIINKLKAYHPDLVFGEYLSADDVGQLPAGSAGPFQRRLKYVQRRALTTAPLTAPAADATRRRLRKKPLLNHQRIDLARYYAFTSDRGNTEYQLYLLTEPLQSHLSAADQAYFNLAFGSPDSLRKAARMVRPLSEYHKIFFPLLRELGQDQMYPMDCQRYETAWNEASGAAYGQFEKLQAGFKFDSTTAQAATFRRIAHAKPAFFAYLNAAADDVDSYRLMNDPSFEQLNNDLNFYGDEALYGAPGFPTEAVRAMKAQWLLRNQGMCDNIVQRARAQGAGRVVVAVGSAHVQVMRRLLAAQPNVRVLTYNDLR